MEEEDAIAAPDEGILFLGDAQSPLVSWLREQGEHVIVEEARIDAEYVNGTRAKFLVSYGYRHILRTDVLSLFPSRAVNLHISYLPWNRGADPNLWSFVDDTPKGVTIHFLDEGVDTGDVIAQRLVDFGDLCQHTLATTYQRLHTEIQMLFKACWPGIRTGTCARVPQTGVGTRHLMKEKKQVTHLLKKGWDTSVTELLGGVRHLDAGSKKDSV